MDLTGYPSTQSGEHSGLTGVCSTDVVSVIDGKPLSRKLQSSLCMGESPQFMCDFYDIRLTHAPVHSIIEHVERYNYFFGKFADRGISVFAFDQRGWGQTGQKDKSFGITSLEKQLKDLEFFLAREEAANPNGKLFLFGHSLVSWPDAVALSR